MFLNDTRYLVPIIGPIKFYHLNIYYQTIENIDELSKRLRLRNLDPSIELPRLIRKGIKRNYLDRGVFSFYAQELNVIYSLNKSSLNEFNVDSYSFLLSEPRILPREKQKKVLLDFLIEYVLWRMDRDPRIIIRVNDDFYFNEIEIGRSKEGLIFTLLNGFSFKVIQHSSGLYIYLIKRFLPRIKPTLDKILSLDVFRGTYEYIRGEYYWDGLLKNMSCITIDEYYKLGKPSYAGRIEKVVYPESPIYEDLLSSISKYYEKERDVVLEFIKPRIIGKPPIVLTLRSKKGLLISYLSNILYLSPTIEELKSILDVLGFKQIHKWYIDQMMLEANEYLEALDSWVQVIREILKDLPLEMEINLIRIS